MESKRPAGTTVPLPFKKGDKPNAFAATPWSNQLVGGNEQRRTVQDFGGPSRYPYGAPTSFVKKAEQPATPNGVSTIGLG